MKEKGFTLIELLAVIVILAIISLIAVPIIMNIISSARESSNKRSIELYGKAVESAFADKQLDGSEVAIGLYTQSDEGKTLTKGNTEITVQYDGSKVECTKNRLYEDGKIYLSGCKVNDKDVSYEYGEYQQTFKPQYYTWDLNGPISNTVAPANPSSVPPEGHSVYLGYDVLNGKVSTGYVCFIRNEREYCLRGQDSLAYSTNRDIIVDAYEDIVDTGACSFNDNASECHGDGLTFFTFATPSGYVDAKNGNDYCDVGAGDHIGCRIY